MSFLTTCTLVYDFVPFPSPLSTALGCSMCHRGITIGDWRDPLDPDLDAQIIYSQFLQGKTALIKKYIPRTPDEDYLDLQDGSNSPSSLSSSGATSLQDHDRVLAALNAAPSPGGQSLIMKDYCRDMLEIIDDLSSHHSQTHLS